MLWRSQTPVLSALLLLFLLTAGCTTEDNVPAVGPTDTSEPLPFPTGRPFPPEATEVRVNITTDLPKTAGVPTVSIGDVINVTIEIIAEDPRRAWMIQAQMLTEGGLRIVEGNTTFEGSIGPQPDLHVERLVLEAASPGQARLEVSIMSQYRVKPLERNLVVNVAE